MGVFKKLSGNDVRVTPVRVKFSKAGAGEIIPGTNKNPAGAGGVASRTDFKNSDAVKTANDVLVYNSIRQLFYGAFISQNFVSSGSVFETPFSGSITQHSQGIFSQYDPSFQGSLGYQRSLPIAVDDTISVLSIPVGDFGESIVPGTFSGSGYEDDTAGNLVNGSGNTIGNVFYDQGIAVRTDGSAIGTATFDASYTVYAAQYKCTAAPNEFNYSMNPTLLSDSNTEYNSAIVDSPDFMPYVTTIGLYNENQELMLVAKLSQPMQLNPYTDTNFIVRLDR